MLIVNQGKCTECGVCVSECHRKALSLTEDGIEWDAERCYGCGHCMALCPSDSLMLDGDGYDITEVEEFNFAARPKAEQVREMVMMRRSIRKFNDNDVSDDELNMILEAGKYAPTAENKQGNVFLVVQSPEKKQEILNDCMAGIEKAIDEVLNGTSTVYSRTLAENLKKDVKAFKEEGDNNLFYDAPVYLFVFSDTVQDGAIAATNMVNMAYGLRLGSCYIKLAADVFENDPALKEKYGIPANKVSAMALAIGDPDVEFFCTVPRKDPKVILL